MTPTIGGGVSLARVLVLALLLAGCASGGGSPASEIRMEPSTSCDQRMLDHNRRACFERGRGFLTPTVPGHCGVCVP